MVLVLPTFYIQNLKPCVQKTESILSILTAEFIGTSDAHQLVSIIRQ